MSADGRRWLRPDVDLQVEWDDATPFGGPIGGRLEDTLREVFAEVVGLLLGAADPIGPDVVAAFGRATAGNAFRALADVGPTAGRRSEGDAEAWSLQPDVVAPDPAATCPARLWVGAHAASADIDIPLDRWPAVHRLVADLHGAGAEVAAQGDAVARAILTGLDRPELMVDRRPEQQPRPWPGLTFVGHATIAVTGAAGTLLVDPFLRPRSDRYPEAYQPMGVGDLGPLAAVLLTHAHPDHADPTTLLRLPVDVPVVVPVVERETILGPDLALRLSQLGFTDVRPRPWGAVERFGDMTVEVLPFYGEQPTSGDQLHPDVTMPGNTYVVTAPWGRVAALADGGADRRGSMVEVAAAVREETGAVDVVCSGFRGWRTSPAELLRSSVGRYALFVPPDRWDRVDALMHDPAGAVAVAEAFGASVLVPYADGGAPWFWELGLGPVLGDAPEERPGFDLFPERVAEAAADADSPVQVAVLLPGHRLTSTDVAVAVSARETRDARAAAVGQWEAP